MNTQRRSAEDAQDAEKILREFLINPAAAICSSIENSDGWAFPLRGARFLCALRVLCASALGLGFKGFTCRFSSKS